MFYQLFNLGYQRNTKEAIGFYIAYMAMAVIFIMVVGPLIQPNGVTDAELIKLMEDLGESGQPPEHLRDYLETMMFYSALFSTVLCATLAVLISQKKGIFTQPKTLGIVVAIIALAYITGPIIGLIPIAWLTTK